MACFVIDDCKMSLRCEALCRPIGMCWICCGIKLSLTFNVIGSAAVLQGEDVVDWSAGVQCVGVPVVADEAVVPSQDQHGPVDQFQSELLVLTWRKKKTKQVGSTRFRGEEIRQEREEKSPMVSLTASNWPFFLVQMYLPLLAFIATLWLSHSTENMVLADLWAKKIPLIISHSKKKLYTTY